MFCRFLQAWVQTPSPNFKSLKIKFQIGIFLDTMLSLKSYLINNLLPQPPHLRVAVNGSDICPKVPMGILLFSEHDFIPRLVPIDWKSSLSFKCYLQIMRIGWVYSLNIIRRSILILRCSLCQSYKIWNHRRLGFSKVGICMFWISLWLKHY